MAPSPVARHLIGLAERRANGSVDVGARRVVLRDGVVVDVRPDVADDTLEEFLERAGRLDRDALEQAKAEALGTGVGVEAVLETERYLGANGIDAARYAVWLDRLVRGLEHDETIGREPSLVNPEPGVEAHDTRFEVLPLLLDALARRAGSGDADAIGVRAHHEFEWLDTPHIGDAMRWADLGPLSERPSVGSILARDPGAAPRLAALVRAGLGRLIHPRETAPPPPPRPPSLAPPAPPPRHLLHRTSEPPPAGRPSIPAAPFFPGEVSLEPASAPEPTPPSDLMAALRAFPAFRGSLDDPLDTLERKIASLEQESADGPSRAIVWKEVARLWATHYDCPEEAARAYREAAAADPTDREALEQASHYCAALGFPQLGFDYARALAALMPPGTQRARVQRWLGLLAQRTGNVAAMLDAFQSAVEDDPLNPETREIFGRALWHGGDRAAMLRHVGVAVSIWRAKQPERARALASFLFTECDDMPSAAEQYAATLAEGGYHEAAVAVLADAARLTMDPDLKLPLVYRAAERAEMSARPDLAAWLLVEAFDESPQLEVLYEPLIADLEASGERVTRAILLEEIATQATGEARTAWFERAAHAWGELSDGTTWALQLSAEALAETPTSGSLIASIREYAAVTHDSRSVVDALERALRTTAREHKSDLVELFGVLADEAEKVGLRARALWALSRIDELEPLDAKQRARLDRLRREVEVEEPLFAAMERELERAADDERPAIKRRLAALAIDHPNQRDRGVKLSTELLSDTPSDRALLESTERALWVMGRDAERAALLENLAETAATRVEKIRALAYAAAIHSLRERNEAVARTCFALLELAPHHREAMTRIERAARRLRDRPLLRRVLMHQAKIAHEPRERARALSTLARDREAAGNYGAAVARATEALSIDPRCAEAATLVLRRVEHLVPDHAVETLRKARSVLGESTALLSALAAAAAAADQPAAQLEAVDAWFRVSPADPEAALARLHAHVQQDDIHAIVQATNDALTVERISKGSGLAVLHAAERLASLGDTAGAVEVLMLAMDRTGSADPELRTASVRYSEETRKREVQIEALERWVSTCRGAARLEPLRRIAALHRAQDHRAAEVRTLLRSLSVSPYNAAALDRLSHLYAESGEVERLMAVLALRLEASQTVAERYERTLDLAAAAFHVARDPDKAEHFIRQLLLECGDDDAHLFRAVGSLVALGRANHAVTVLLDIARESLPARAALLAERAVWIAEQFASDPVLALDVAISGLALAPHHLSLLVMAERIALGLGDVAKANRIYDELGRRALGEHGRRAILYRQARWLERAGDNVAALEVHLGAFRLSPRTGSLLRAIERLCLELTNFDVLAGVYAQLGELASDPQTRWRFFDQAARVFETRLDSPERGAEMRARARELGAAAGELDSHGVNEELTEDLDPQTDDGNGEASFAGEHGQLAVDPPSAEIRATEMLAKRLSSDPSRAEEAIELVKGLLRRDPGRTDLWRVLYRASLEAGSEALTQVSAALLSLFDPAVPVLEEEPTVNAARCVDQLEIMRQEADHAPALALLTLVWEGAMPVFRRTPRDYGVSGIDRVSLRQPTTAVGHAYSLAVRVLDAMGTPLYVRRAEGGEVVVARTQPPSIVADAGIEGDDVWLRFIMGRAVELARPEHVLIASLPAEDASALLEAVCAAFGPADEVPTISKQAASLAAELWRTLPPRMQRHLRDLVLKAPPESLQYESLRNAVNSAAACAGLVVAGAVRTAAQTAFALDTGNGESLLGTETGFASAVNQSAPLRNVIRFALSDEFLSAQSPFADT